MPVPRLVRGAFEHAASLAGGGVAAPVLGLFFFVGFGFGSEVACRDSVALDAAVRIATTAARQEDLGASTPANRSSG